MSENKVLEHVALTRMGVGMWSFPFSKEARKKQVIEWVQRMDTVLRPLVEFYRNHYNEFLDAFRVVDFPMRKNVEEYDRKHQDRVRGRIVNYHIFGRTKRHGIDVRYMFFKNEEKITNMMREYIKVATESEKAENELNKIYGRNRVIPKWIAKVLHVDVDFINKMLDDRYIFHWNSVHYLHEENGTKFFNGYIGNDRQGILRKLGIEHFSLHPPAFMEGIESSVNKDGDVYEYKVNENSYKYFRDRYKEIIDKLKNRYNIPDLHSIVIDTPPV